MGLECRRPSPTLVIARLVRAIHTMPVHGRQPELREVKAQAIVAHARADILRLYSRQSAQRGTLYTGITNNLSRRIYEHREGLVEGFTKKYNVKRLVYFEQFPTAADAIHREKQIKKYPRAWKINLIRTQNPDWRDLAEGLNA